MITEPIGLPDLPYRITYNTNSGRIIFKMCAYVCQKLRFEEIHFTRKGKIVFKMRNDDKYSTLKRITTTEIISVEEAMQYVNEYLCQTAFHLNALRGHGFTGYIVIPELEGSYITGTGKNHIDFHVSQGKRNIKYHIDTKTYFLLDKNGEEHMEFDLRHIPYQVVQLAKKVEEERLEREEDTRCL